MRPDPSTWLEERFSKLAAQSSAIDLGLDRVQAALEALGNPQTRLPPTIHVAGTNGKGSTLAFCRTILEEHGYTVHAYTSPHLVSITERFVLAGREIASSDLLGIFEKVQAACKTIPLTHFEFLTVAAFKAMSEVPADFLLLENGLGGRLDATNVIQTPRATAITSIGFDHMEFLGSTHAAIAREKAGIIKHNVPCVVGGVSLEAGQAIQTIAAARGAPMLRMGQEWHVCDHKDGFEVCTLFKRRLQLQRPALLGAHQITNAAMAIAILHAALEGDGRVLEEARINSGLAKVRWPGRLQNIASQNLYKAFDCSSHADESHEWWLDGAHNEAGARVLAHFLRHQSPAEPTTVILGMVGNKDAFAFIDQLVPAKIQKMYCVPIPELDCASPHKLHEIAQSRGMNAIACKHVEDAIRAVPSEPAGQVVICGSLYLIGYVLEKLQDAQTV